MKLEIRNWGEMKSVYELDVYQLAEELSDEILRPEEHLFQQSVIPPKNKLESAAKLIEASRRPIIFGGWGIRHGGDEIMELAKPEEERLLKIPEEDKKQRMYKIDD